MKTSYENEGVDVNPVFGRVQVLFLDFFLLLDLLDVVIDDSLLYCRFCLRYNAVNIGADGEISHEGTQEEFVLDRSFVVDILEDLCALKRRN